MMFYRKNYYQLHETSRYRFVILHDVLPLRLLPSPPDLQVPYLTENKLLGRHEQEAIRNSLVHLILPVDKVSIRYNMIVSSANLGWISSGESPHTHRLNSCHPCGESPLLNDRVVFSFTLGRSITVDA
ncbi:unnamed protein product [Phytophthora fragariaefolia]|uniref:Unnamed protein product n=1 Tax=Phytophthora fragariaefolia TaxID=1490495 RepID=A0A9W6XPJ0_9STRA|nr:unnamed protein product [Phytophthora fragariaefolia]